MIGAYAHHGMGSKALNTFKTMIEAGLKPDEVTFISVLNACSQSGMPREALDILNQMESKFSIIHSRTNTISKWSRLINSLSA
jgi:pentatricopeptide repeat protein